MMLLVAAIFILPFIGSVVTVKPPKCEIVPTCPEGEHYTRNDPECRRTCANHLVPNDGLCKPYTGCACNPGLVRLNKDATGPCVPEKLCPSVIRPIGNSKDQVYTTKADATGYAIATKEYSISDPSSNSSGHFSSKSSSISSSSSSYTSVIRQRRGNRCRDRHAVFKNCPNPCPLTCASPNPKPCARMCIKEGCECRKGYVLNEINGRCVRPWHCPEAKRCPKHSHYVVNDSTCQKNCGNRLVPGMDTAGACEPFTGCVCKQGFVRQFSNNTGPCIPERRCPPIPTTCGLNEEPTSCRVICPPQTCESIYSSYYCLPTECEPGCNCINGYLRNYNGECVPVDNCFNDEPVCGLNEIETDCEIVCPPQSCESLYTTYMCIETNCTAGCNCIDGYLRNSLGICIPSDQCGTDPSVCNGDLNATKVECGTACPATCDNPQPEACADVCVLNGCQCKSGYILTERGGVCIDPKDCPVNSGCNGDLNATYSGCTSGCPAKCADLNSNDAISCPDVCGPAGCVCNPGYILNDKGQCVKPEDCPAKPVDDGCNGDLNATSSECPSSCPATCANRNKKQKITFCPAVCRPGGCVCKPGFILTEINGTCVAPQDCPDEPPTCGVNETFVDCKYRCSEYCPISDSRAQIACLIASPCPSGCACKPDYLKLSYDNPVCVKASDCPEVECTRPNEVFRRNITGCFSDRCEDKDKLCDPDDATTARCVCKEGFFRNESDVCVPASECRKRDPCSGDLNSEFRACTSACEPTCSNPGTNVICIDMCYPPGCVCKPGFVRSESEGKCVKPEECPVPQCNGDRNATSQECPSPCQPTCDQPEIKGACTKMCVKEGCVCKDGYLRNSTDGPCIQPEDCSGGSPTCGTNETYVRCNVGCPNNFCPKDDNLAIVVCDPINPCPGGCACKQGYLRLGEEDDTCVLGADCPPINCTRPNEVYNPNPPDCLQDRCDNRNTPCDFPYRKRPSCVCIDGYFRNSDGICVPESECHAFERITRN